MPSFLHLLAFTVVSTQVGITMAKVIYVVFHLSWLSPSSDGILQFSSANKARTGVCSWLIETLCPKIFCIHSFFFWCQKLLLRSTIMHSGPTIQVVHKAWCDVKSQKMDNWIESVYTEANKIDWCFLYCYTHFWLVCKAAITWIATMHLILILSFCMDECWEKVEHILFWSNYWQQYARLFVSQCCLHINRKSHPD